MRRFVVTSIMVSAYVGMLFSQAVVKGRITDAEGLPLIGANVYIDNSFKGAVSDPDGYYEITQLREGEYLIIASYMGYHSLSKNIVLQADTDLDFVLTRSSYLAEEVIVRSTRAGTNAPFTYSSIGKEELQERNVGQDLPYLINLSPSLVATSDAGTGIGYSNLRLRGTDLNRINVTVNGIPLNDAESHGVWFIDLPDLASSIENIQIQRGVGTSTNGGAAFGASLNFQTMTLTQDPYARWNMSAGSYKTLKNTISLGTGLIKDHFALDLRLSKIGSAGYIDRASSDLKSFFLSGAWHGEKSLLKLNIFSGWENTYTAWNGVPADSLETNPTFNPSGMRVNADGSISYYENESDNYQQDHLQLLFSHELSRQLTLNAALHYTYGRGYYEEYRDTTIWPYETFASYGLQNLTLDGVEIDKTNLVRQKWLDNDFYGMTWSINYKRNQMDMQFGGAGNIYSGRHFGKIIWSQHQAYTGEEYEWYRGNGKKYDASTYLKTSYRLFSDLSLFGDLQLRFIEHEITGIHDDLRNIDQVHDYFFFNPKLGMIYRPADNQELYFSFAQASREPNRTNFVYSDPSHPVPSDEMLRDYEFGYKGRLSLLEYEAVVYYMDYRDQLVLTGEINDVAAAIMTNVPESYRAGIELLAGLRPRDKLLWNINLTLSKNRIKNYTGVIDNWDYWYDQANEPYQYSESLGETDIAFSPSVVAGSRIRYDIFESLTASLTTKYVGKQYMDNTSSSLRRLDPYLLNDIQFRFSTGLPFAEELSFMLMVNNIFDTRYESNAWIYRYFTGGEHYTMYGYYPQAGRHLMLGFSLSF